MKKLLVEFRAIGSRGCRFRKVAKKGGQQLDFHLLEFQLNIRLNRKQNRRKDKDKEGTSSFSVGKGLLSLHYWFHFYLDYKFNSGRVSKNK